MIHRGRHAKSHRALLHGLLVVAALGGVQVAQAQVGTSDLAYSRSGSTWWFSNGDPNMGKLLGKSFVPGKFGVLNGEALGVKKDMTLPVGKGVPVQIGTKFTRASFAKALVTGVSRGGVYGIALTLAADALIDYGLSNVRLGEDGSLVADDPTGNPPPLVVGGQQSSVWGCESGAGLYEYFYATVVGVGLAEFVIVPYQDGSVPGFGLVNNCAKFPAQGGYFPRLFRRSVSEIPPVEAAVLSGQVLADWIASRTGWPESSAIALQDMLTKPATSALLEPQGVPTVTGPATVPGEKVVTSEQVDLIPGTTKPAAPGTPETQKGTKVTEKTKTIEATYDGDKVTTKEKTSTTISITNNTTNATTTETGEETKEDTESPDFCKTNPDSIVCAEMDTPDVEIPRASRSVDFEVEDSFGSGTCPADVYVQVNGQSVMVFDWGEACGYVQSYVRPLVLALSAFAALMIIMPGGRNEA